MCRERRNHIMRLTSSVHPGKCDHGTGQVWGTVGTFLKNRVPTYTGRCRPSHTVSCLSCVGGRVKGDDAAARVGSL